MRKSNLFAFCMVLVLLSRCTSSTITNRQTDSVDVQAKKTVQNLFDTASLAPRNTATFHSIEIRQMIFVPETLAVHKGDTIAWVNNDIVTHDVTEEKNKEWTSSPLPVGKSWQMIAVKSADYYCSIHVMMKGKIVVE